MTRDEIINKVRVKMDEIVPASEDIIISSSSHVKPLYEIIDDLLDNCANEVVLEAPSNLLPKASLVGEGELVKNVGDTTGAYALPLDYIRLLGIQLTSWSKPVFEVHLIDSQIGKQQFNKFTRGGVTKPVALRMPEQVAGLLLFPVNTGDEVVDGGYVQKIDDITTLSTDLVEALSWRAAADVFTISRMPEQAAICSQRLAEFYARNTY